MRYVTKTIHSSAPASSPLSHFPSHCGTTSQIVSPILTSTTPLSMTPVTKPPTIRSFQLRWSVDESPSIARETHVLQNTCFGVNSPSVSRRRSHEYMPRFYRKTLWAQWLGEPLHTRSPVRCSAGHEQQNKHEVSVVDKSSPWGPCPCTASAAKGHLSNKQHYFFSPLFVLICNTRKAVLAPAASYLQMTNGSSRKWVHRDAEREEGSYQ